jgi:hypothetical protein
MQKQILAELKELRISMAYLVGTPDLPPEEQFSKEALDKVAASFRLLTKERGEWVEGKDIGKVIRNAPHNAGSFLINELKFKAYFKKAYSYYFHKKSLVALRDELKERNVDLKRFMELREDQAKFKKSMEKAAKLLKSKKSKKLYELNDDVKDILSTPALKPHIELIQEDIRRLRNEFEEQKLFEYVDIYKETHAMFKEIYWFRKYIDNDIKNRCKKWIEDFNYANYALKKANDDNEI